VLITGETGTGKELTARAIHNASGKEAPFVAVNIASVAENLIDDELFGHSKGAFTGAQTERAGMVEKASGGTLFLDEIGDLSTAVQVKLLRLIQERQYQRLGSDEVRTTNARIVAATNSSLGLKVKNEAFRADLYYRLATHRIHLPPLRDRKDDIPILVDSFLESAALEMNKNKPTPPKQLFTLLSTYDFPGNVRELRSMIFDAVSLHQSGTLSMDSFRSKVQKTSCDVVDANAANTDENKKIQFSGILPTLKEAQDILIDEALKAADGNQTIAAGILGMSRRALNSRLSRQQSKEL
jgi:DNA-binding NtrC family response regulator